MNVFTHGRYATVASTAALVISLGATSYAAVMVTSADIKDNTVTTKDVKDRSLKVKDLAARTRARLTGPSGATGPAGPAGGAGIAGPVGPSEALHVHNNTITSFPDMNVLSNKTLLSVDLAPGQYVIVSKVRAVNAVAGALFAQCILTNPNGPQDLSRAVFLGGGDTTVTNQIAFSAASAVKVDLSCYGDNANFSEKRLTAIKAGAVTVTAYPHVP